MSQKSKSGKTAKYQIFFVLQRGSNFEENGRTTAHTKTPLAAVKEAIKTVGHLGHYVVARSLDKNPLKFFVYRMDLGGKVTRAFVLNTRIKIDDSMVSRYYAPNMARLARQVTSSRPWSTSSSGR